MAGETHGSSILGTSRYGLTKLGDFSEQEVAKNLVYKRKESKTS